MPERDKLLLVDANSLIHQAFHAVQPLTTRDGQPTNAIFGFANMLLRLLEDERPAALALAFDTPQPTFRHERFADYKGHRPPLDDTLLRQLPLIDELIEAFRWVALRAPGFEADDILATLARRAAPAWDVYIVTADRDLCQLVCDGITVLATQARGVTDVHRFDVPAVLERFGVPPEKLPDWKALVGDSSDNLPGVPGIGPKTATELLQAHGDLEAVLAAADGMKGKRRENLLAGAEQARLSRELATICDTCPIELELEELRRRPMDDEAVTRILTRIEFHSLLRRLSPRAVTAPVTVAYETVADDAAAARVAREVAAAKVVGLAWRADLAGVAVSTDAGRAWYLPLARREGEQLALFADEAPADGERARLDTGLAPLAEGRVGYLAHDVQKLYRGLGVDAPALAQFRGDTLLAAWLLDPEKQEHPIVTLAQRYLGTPPPEAAPEGHPEPGAFLACRDADLARRLEPRLREDLEAEHLLDLYLTMELPLVPVLARMMACGVVVDRAATGELDDELADAIADKRAEIHGLAGFELAVDSPKQLGEYLFGELGLPAGRKTKTGYSTDAATLGGLLDRHPIIAPILEYRELTKLKSTYTDVLLARSDPETGRITTQLNQTGAATGRLSSSQPNLQNIPIRGRWGERFRNLFTVPPGWLLLAADYSQIELRVLAAVSGDARLREAFRGGEDIHHAAAQEIFGVAEDQVTSEMRRRAKVLNFGIAYGIQPHGLSQRLEIPRAEAQALIEAYFQRFPGVKQYAEDTIARARQSGYVQTLFGRRRRLVNLNSPNPNLRQAAERAAINMPIQGTAADILKRAMLRLDELLAGLASRMTLQVHDELLLEVAPEELAEVAARVAGAMTEAAALEVPLEVKIGVGAHWGALEPYVPAARR